MDNRNNTSKERIKGNNEKINESYSRGDYGKNGTTTEERAAKKE